MTKIILILSLTIAAPLLIAAQSSRAPDALQKTLQVKSLTDVEVQSYLTGRGMGLAKPAELNSYPGPMHVLELAEKLRLSTTQSSEIQKAFGQMRTEAVNLGKSIVQKEAELNRLFSEKKINQVRLRARVQEIARLQGELRVVHLKTHLEIRQFLTSDQINNYNHLRGYGTSEVIHQHQ